MIGAPNYVGHAHIEIVRHHSQVVGGVPVRPHQNKILEVTVFSAGHSKDLVVKGGLPGVGHAKAQSARTFLGKTLFDFLFGQIAARAVVLPRALFGFGPGALRL